LYGICSQIFAAIEYLFLSKEYIKMKSEKYPQYLQQIIIVLGLIMGVLNFIGALSIFPALSERVPTMTLILLSITLIPLILKVDKVGEENVKSITSLAEKLDGLDGKNVRKFSNQSEIFGYFKDRSSTIRSSVDVTDLDSFDNGNFESTARREYYLSFSQMINRGIVRMRRIHILSDMKDFERLKCNLEDNSKGKYCAGYYIEIKSKIPYPSMMVIDEEEVCFAPPIREYGSSTCISVKNKVFASAAKEHMEILWANKHGYIDNFEDKVKLKEIEDKIRGL
jgi:hypothetical protein